MLKCLVFNRIMGRGQKNVENKFRIRFGREGPRIYENLILSAYQSSKIKKKGKGKMIEIKKNFFNVIK